MTNSDKQNNLYCACAIAKCSEKSFKTRNITQRDKFMEFGQIVCWMSRKHNQVLVNTFLSNTLSHKKIMKCCVFSFAWYIYALTQTKNLYIVFKSICFDDKLIFGVNFFLSSNLQCLIDVSEKILDENQKLHTFYE